MRRRRYGHSIYLRAGGFCNNPKIIYKTSINSLRIVEVRQIINPRKPDVEVELVQVGIVAGAEVVVGGGQRIICAPGWYSIFSPPL